MPTGTKLDENGHDNRSVPRFHATPSSNTFARKLKPLPSHKQAVIFPAIDNTSVLDYVIAVGRIIGPKNVLSASKISKNRVCLYLLDENTANTFVVQHKSIIINEQPVEVRKLVALSKKIIFSNVHSCIPNSIILEELLKMGYKPTSAIFELHIGLASEKYNKSELEQYTHISSFRRGVYVAHEQNNLPDSMLITYEGDQYRIFLSDNEIKCHFCHTAGHTADTCTLHEANDTNGENTFNENPATSSNPLKRAHPSTTSSNISTPPLSTPIAPEITGLNGKDATPTPPSPLIQSKDASPTNKSKQRKRKKSKRVNIDNNTQLSDSELNSATSDHSDIDSSSTEASPAQTKELLQQIKEQIYTKYARKLTPMNFANFVLLLDAVRGKTNVDDVQAEIQNFIISIPNFEFKNIFDMLTEYYPLVPRCMKIRFTKLRKQLINIQPNLPHNTL